MPNAVFRSLTGLISSAMAGRRRWARHPVRCAAGVRSVSAQVTAGEALEERRLFALAITPLPAAASAPTLGATLLVPNTGLAITGGTYVGLNDQGGTFTGFDMTTQQNQRLNIQDGVLLTTGLANNALGPNDSPATAALLLSPGDPDLDALTELPTFDANSLTLNFTTDIGTRSVLFDFIFGTEEYNEFVGTIFNDAFAAYLDGVQVSFDINGRPITVNNNFFRINNIGATLDIEYDGLTPRIRTHAPLNPTIANHTLKFVIADTGDTDYDSGVFIGRLQGSTVAIAAPVTDLPNPGVLAFSTTSYSVDETGGSATIQVTRLNGTSGQVTVNYAVAPGTATDLLDYTGTAGTLVFADGQTSQAITIPVIDDLLPEGDETVVVTLANAVDAGLGFPNVATLTILDNELAITFVPPQYTVSETSGVATLSVTRSGDLSGPASVDYTTGADPLATAPATAPADYATTSGTINFAPGQKTVNITVPVVGDFDDDEPAEETFGAALSNPVGAALGVLSAARVTITNVDRPPSVFDITAFAPSGRIDALYLKVNDPLVAARAIDPAYYDLFQHHEKRFNGPPARRRVAIRAVDYNPGLRTIQIIPARPLKNNVFYEVVLRGTLETGLISATNEPLDGNLDRVTFFPGEDFVGYFGRGNRLLYNDRNGDKVKLGTTGGGVIEVFRDVSRDARTVRYVGATSGSTVWGTVIPTWRGSDRVTDIGTLILGGARSVLGTAFRIGATHA